MSREAPSPGCYCFIFCLLATILIMDITCNVLSGKTMIRNGFLKALGLAIFQILNILFGLLLFFYSIFRTSVAKAGFVGILFKRFRATVIITVVYLIFTILLNSVSIFTRMTAPLVYNWPVYLKILFFFQRLFSVLWYYTCKRAILRLGDPRFYDEEWVRHTLVHHESQFPPPLLPKPVY